MSTIRGVTGGGQGQSATGSPPALGQHLPTEVALSPRYLSASRGLIPNDRWHRLVDTGEGNGLDEKVDRDSDRESDKEPNGRHMVTLEASSTFC